jgi:hypothetical protein
MTPQTVPADRYLSSCPAITMRWMWPVPPQIRVTAKPRPVSADLDDAILTDARWPEGVRLPVGWIVDGDSGRLKRAGGSLPSPRW